MCCDFRCRIAIWDRSILPASTRIEPLNAWHAASKSSAMTSRFEKQLESDVVLGRSVSSRGFSAQLEGRWFGNQARRHRVGLVANQDVHRILVSHCSRHFPAHVRDGFHSDSVKLPVAYLQHHVFACEVFLDPFKGSMIEPDQE